MINRFWLFLTFLLAFINTYFLYYIFYVFYASLQMMKVNLRISTVFHWISNAEFNYQAENKEKSELTNMRMKIPERFDWSRGILFHSRERLMAGLEITDSCTRIGPLQNRNHCCKNKHISYFWVPRNQVIFNIIDFI